MRRKDSDLGIPKEKPAEEAVLPDLSNERELKLARDFADPSIEEMIPGLSDPERPGDVVAEAAAAIEELVLDASAAPVDLLLLQGQDVERDHAPAQLEMAERFFELVICEKPFADMVEEMLVLLMKSVGAEAGSVLELDHEKKEFFFRASFGGGDPEKLKAFRVPFTKGIVGHVAESLQPVVLGNPEIDEQQLLAISASVGFEARHCVALPFLVANQLYGVVEVFNKMGGHGGFDQRDLRLLEAGLRMASKVLEVRFLMAELARRVR